MPGLRHEKGRAGGASALLGPFSLAGIDALSPRSYRFCSDAQATGEAVACGIPGFCDLTCEQSVLFAPVELQIEFGQPGRGELDGPAALQDRFPRRYPLG